MICRKLPAAKAATGLSGIQWIKLSKRSTFTSGVSNSGRLIPIPGLMIKAVTEPTTAANREDIAST